MAMLIGNVEQEIAWVVDEFSNHPFDPKRKIVCTIGDPVFERLVYMLAERIESQHEEQVRIWQQDIELDKQDPSRSTEKQKEYRRRLLGQAECVRNIDYSDELKRQLERFNANGNGKTSFNGLPFSFFLYHEHAYYAIRDYLLKTEEPVVIVRLDAHPDCSYATAKKIGSANYIFYLMHDADVGHKIKEVITASSVTGSFRELKPFPRDRAREEEINPKRCSSHIINGKRHTLCQIEDLPEINGPSILDFDLDGHEDVDGIPHGRGYYMTLRYDRHMAAYHNQKCILVHPKVAAGIFQQRVRDPRLILVATERSFRNGYFHYRIEHDFLEQLAE